MKNTGLFLGGIIAGAVLGAAAALLYAPQTGTETRKDIKDKLDDLEKELEVTKGKIKSKGGELKDELKEKMGNLESKIEQLISQAKKAPEASETSAN
ncbi:YtxH domain-containing protein [Saccharicrinis aurantiacus]|uniref:YtxH domain-containing protein n=1 Tax=Saccharicrinis aurantiacus TaxID=1849719 RepID=UPI0008383A5D|nr:YtxH domain-containing protein [Saccharicrinis aurantiacus]